MGFLDSLKTWFRSESAEAKDLLGETKGRLETDLDRREADLAATPAERLEQLQEQIDGNDSLGALRDKIEGRGAKAEAVEELMVTPIDDADVVDAEIVDEADPRPVDGSDRATDTTD